MNSFVLQVDVSGTPQDWVSLEHAATMLCNHNVAWTHGEKIVTLHGGYSHAGVQSTLDIPAIIATRGLAHRDVIGVPSLTNAKLFERDRHICAYCGSKFPAKELTREHIVPTSHGGRDVWTNVVAACRACNCHKSNHSLEEAGFSLLYLPYEPNWFEDFLLQRSGRQILADQMEFLVGRIPATSRLLPA